MSRRIILCLACVVSTWCLEIDPVLASAAATYLVRSPHALSQTHKCIRKLSRRRILQKVVATVAIERLVYTWACSEDLTMGRLVLDSVCTQTMELLLDTLSTCSKYH
jgi:hypothetical protein